MADTSTTDARAHRRGLYAISGTAEQGMTIVAGRREDDNSVTLGEVYRLITALKDDHGEKLDAIDKQVRITNGRTTTLEAQVKALMMPLTPPSLPVTTVEGESLSIKISPKMWAAIVALGTALVVLLPTLQKWFDKLIGQK